MAGSISSTGIGSGLDVNNIITQLMSVERAPLQRLEAQAQKFQTQLSAFGQLKSLVSAVKDATGPLLQANSYRLTQSTTSDPTTVSAGTGPAAVPGSYSIAVTSLAATQMAVSAAGQFVNAADAVGTGTIIIRSGSWNSDQTVFAPKTGSSDVVISIGASDNSLQAIRDKINTANAGVTATIVTDASGARLALQSTSTGAENGFKVTIDDDDANDTDINGLSRLAFDPPSGGGRLTLAQSAANAAATINGISVSSSTNQLTDVIEGLTLNLGKVTSPGQPVLVNVTRNTDALKTMVTSLVTSYNALTQFIAGQTRYDTATRRAALLQGDSTVVGIQNQFSSTITSASTANSSFSTLSSIGVEMQKDGTLKVNDQKLTAALKDLPSLQQALTNPDSAGATAAGFAVRLSKLADQLIANDGSLTGRSAALQSRVKANEKDQDTFNSRLSMVEKRLRAQYTALDSTMSQANALSKYVQQQITTWNKGAE